VWPRKAHGRTGEEAAAISEFRPRKKDRLEQPDTSSRQDSRPSDL